MNNKLLSTLKFLIGWPLSLVALFFLIKIIAPKINLLTSIRSINLSLLILSAIFFIGYNIFRALLWKAIAQQRQVEIGFKEVFYLWGFSEFKRYTPGNVWSFISRGKATVDKGAKKQETIYFLGLEVELIIISCFMLSSWFLIVYFQNNILSLSISVSLLLVLVVFIFGNNFIKNKWISMLLPRAKPIINLRLLIISLLSFLFFGLGMYFASISIIHLDSKYIFENISLFVFSLLLGYLSLITPMGLGVREGAIAFYLSAFTTVANAGLAGIFSRIVQIVSEIIFLALAFVLHKSKLIL